MLDGCILLAWSTEAIDSAQVTASYLNNSYNKTQASECENTSKSDVVFEWYHS